MYTITSGSSGIKADNNFLTRWKAKFTFHRAKTPRTLSKVRLPLAPFAPLREILRFVCGLFAVSSRMKALLFRPDFSTKPSHEDHTHLHWIRQRVSFRRKGNRTQAQRRYASVRPGAGHWPLLPPGAPRSPARFPSRAAASIHYHAV